EGRVDLGYLLPELGVVALRQAAGDHQALGAAGFLLARHLQHGVDRLLLGPVDERASVDDDDVRLLGVRREGIAAALELSQHLLAVDEVLGTLQGDEADGLRAQLALLSGGESIWFPHSRSFSRSLAA